MNEFEFEGKKVIATSNEDWKFDGVESEKIKSINPDLYGKLQVEVAFYLENRERIEEEKRKEQLKEKIKNQTEAQNKFKKELYDNNAEALKNYNITFPSPETEHHFNPESFSINGFTIRFEDRVFDGWRYVATTKVWVVEDLNYKTRRYSNLGTAIKKTTERVEERKIEKEMEAEKKMQTAYEEGQMLDFAKENGFEFSKNWHNSQYLADTNGYYTYEMVKNEIFAKLAYNKETDSVIITNCKINKKLSIDQVNKIMEMI